MSKAHFAILILAGAGIAILSFGTTVAPLLDIRPWALGDAGGHLVLPQLLADGLRPNIDFAYTYGPATIALNAAWAAVFGNQWQSFFVLFAILHLALATSMVALVYSLRLPPLAAVACLLALLHFLRFEYSISHLAEKILLINAATGISAGRFRVALLLCTASALFRPASGLMAGAILLIGLATQQVRSDGVGIALRSIVRVSLPSASLILIAGIIYSATIGFKSLLLTILPISGSKLYGAPSLVAPMSDLATRFLPSNQNFFGYLGANPSHVTFIAIIGLFIFSAAYVTSRETDNRVHAIAFLSFAILATWFATFSGGVFYTYYVPSLWVGLVALAILPDIQPTLRLPIRIAFAVTVGTVLISTAYKFPSMVHAAAAIAKNDFRELTVPEVLKTDIDDARRRVSSGPISSMPFMGNVSLLASSGITAPRPWSWCFRSEGFNLEPELAAARQQLKDYPWFVIRNDQIDYFPLSHLVQSVHQGRYLTLFVAKQMTSRSSAEISR